MMANANQLAALITPWFASTKRDLPWRRPGFSPWGSLVSEFMLQQTPVIRVIPHLEEWLVRWPTPADLANDSPGEAVRAWKKLGYPRRALWLHACAVSIVERHNGIVPHAIDDLLALPGVGDYTARAVAVFAYGYRHPVVDTNIRRVIARAVNGNGESGPPSRKDFNAMENLLPSDPDMAQVFNAGMMELGAVVCVSRSPRCAECPFFSVCKWKNKGYPKYEGPRKKPQKKYEGSDRQVRGVILAALRNSHIPVPCTDFEVLWNDSIQRNRALEGLVHDGLVVYTEHGYVLP